MSNEVLGDARAAFTLTVTRPGGARIVANVIVDHAGGLIRRQVDVEARD